MTAIPPVTPNDAEAAPTTARVSTARGWWSVILALGSAVVLWGVGLAVAFALMPLGDILDPDYQAALGVAYIVILVIVIAMVIAAVVLGVASIVGAWRQSGRPRRTTAIVLGWIGIGLSALMGWVLLMVV